MAYRMNPVEDVRTLPHRAQGHGPKREHDNEEDSTLLMDATMKGDLPPLALPKREYMERAKAIWDRLGLPGVRPQPPWYGYSLGDWLPQWDEAALRAVAGRYLENGRISEKLKRKGVKPETKFRPDQLKSKSATETHGTTRKKKL
jgi:4-hydroxy-3-polyprenylbenzoate decarboxylase